MILRLGEGFDALEYLAVYPRILLQSPPIVASALRLLVAVEPWKPVPRKRLTSTSRPLLRAVEALLPISAVTAIQDVV